MKVENKKYRASYTPKCKEDERHKKMNNKIIIEGKLTGYQWPSVIYKYSFLFIYFNWRLITLQYCDGFCHTLTWISHGCTCVPILNPPPTSLPIPSLRLSQCTSFECPVTGIECGLVIYFTYGNLHVPMLFSQIIPPSPSPTESKKLFFISVSLLLSHI